MTTDDDDDDAGLDDGDARADFGLDRRAARFVDWLIVLAPLHARAFSREGGPMWNAIFDLRAAAWRSDDGDSPGNVWCLNSPEAVYDDLRHCIEWDTGLILPRRLFDAVWQLYRDFLEGVGQDQHQVWAIDAPSDNHVWHMRTLAQWVVRYLSFRPGWTVAEAAESFASDRYGCDPDSP
ncbi:MAG: hypothetical protein U5N10_12850 [Gemmobacter sp.]|nr:hypothetical protein [Gemmobacter sp.]